MGRSSRKRVVTSSAGPPAAAPKPADPAQVIDIFHRTKMCKFFIMGMCTRGDGCQYAHSKDQLSPLPDLTCTKLCSELIKTGSCADPCCKFAHTREELRTSATYRGRRLCKFKVEDACPVSMVKASNIEGKGPHTVPMSMTFAPQVLKESSHLPQAGATPVQPQFAANGGGNWFTTGLMMPLHALMQAQLEQSSAPQLYTYSSMPENCADVKSAFTPPESFETPSTSFAITNEESGSQPGSFVRGASERSKSDEDRVEVVQTDLLGQMMRVSVKNTFLDFQDEPRKPIRTVRTAEGRLDLLADDDEESMMATLLPRHRSITESAVTGVA